MGGGGGFRAKQTDPRAVAAAAEKKRLAAEAADAKKKADFKAFQMEQRPGVRAFEQTDYERRAGVQPLTLEGVRDIETGDLLSQYKSDPYAGDAQKALKEQAFSQGQSPWAKMQMDKQRQEQMSGMDVAAKQGVGAMAQGQSQLAMSGGLSTGARERMARSGSRDLMMAKQGIGRQGISERLNIGSQDIDRKQSMLSDFANAENAAQQQNIGRLTTDVGSLNDYQAKRYGKQMEAWGTKQSADAQRAAAAKSGGGCFVAETLITMADESEKKIADVVLGDILMGGGRVIGQSTYGGGIPHDLYEYEGVLLTGSHAVQEDDEFVRVEDSKGAVKTGVTADVVYNLITEKHIILASGIVFGDDMESDDDFVDDEQSLAALNGE